MIIKYRVFLCLYLTASISTAYGESLISGCKEILLRNKNNAQIRLKSEDAYTDIKYLGVITVSKNKLYKVVTTKYVWGPNYHTAASIRIYNIDNIYVGKYILGDARDLPLKIRNYCLIFSNKEKGCTVTVYQKMKFKKGLPREIFLNACGKFGDLYSFTTDS